MGCNDSRKLYPEEEQVLMHAEALLCFQTKPVQSLYEAFTALARGGVLNSNAFRDAVSALTLPEANEKFPGLLERFYRSLKDANQTVDLQTVQLLCLFLGAGRPLDRAKLLFQTYDQDYSLVLSKSTVSQMMKDLIRVSVDVLGQLGAIGEPEHMEEYLTGLRSVREDFAKARIDGVMEGKTEISRTEFELIFTQSVQSQLLTSSGVRLALFECRREKLVKSRPRVPAGLSLLPPKTQKPDAVKQTGP